MSKSLEKYIKVAICVAMLAMLIASGSVGFYAVTRWQNDSRVVTSQQEYYKALSENVGKPQIIEQRYYSPQVK